MEDAGLDPQDGILVRAVCQHLLDAMNAGLPVSEDEAAKVVARKRDEAIANLAQTLPPDEFARRFPAYRDKIAQQNIEAAKKRRAPRSTKPRAKGEKASVSAADYWASLREKMLAGG
jgi:hypothetical protein